MLILKCEWGIQLQMSMKQWEKWTRNWKVGDKLGCVQYLLIICLINIYIYYKLTVLGTGDTKVDETESLP